MDRYFYFIEYDPYTHEKFVHLSGNVYFNDADETEMDHRIAQWTGLYMALSHVKEMLDDDTFYDNVNERVNYLTDITETRAQEIYNTYFCGTSGEELHIKDINEDTPCGEYWFDA